jgi:hypothetical protein
MSGSVDSVASKKDGALIRPATDRAKVGHSFAFLTEEALLRLEEGLRDAGLRAALLVLGQSPRPFPAPPSRVPPQSPPGQQPIQAQRPTTDRGDAPASIPDDLSIPDFLRRDKRPTSGSTV